MPTDALIKNSKKERTLSTDPKEQLLPNHQLSDANKHLHGTAQFHAQLKSLDFRTVDKIPSGQLVLPTLGYRGLKVDVYVNGVRHSPKVTQGKLAIDNRHSISPNSLIVIRQHIPLFSAISLLISLITFLCLIFLAFPFTLQLFKLNN
ncbi:hypothetical protein [Furfurilactobacillus rossiae]|uniref:hypothetical protein n=1 Tax=Furfurilactobacillus rossiae TaxID=231049 RepID=UPI001265E64E|nr:hypothetical protein [Furfurilactobacillus rossiae]